MKSSKKVKVYTYICFLVVFLLIFPVIAHAKSVHLILVKYDSEMKSVGSKTYVERSMEPSLQEGILEDIKVSTEAIANVFGGKSASPFLIFVQSDQGQQNYAENPTGQTYYYSWGNYIVFGPKGRNTAVISHELVHAELRERLLNKDRVPAWFDEGLATMVDGRYSDNQSVWDRETDNGKQNINFDKMNSHAAFAYGTAEAETNYNLACYEVTRWYSIVGQDGMMKFISELNSDKDFNSVYSSIEADS